MKSGHEETIERLPDYLEGSLSDDLRDSVESHIMDCRECWSELSFIAELRKIEVPDPSALFWQTLPRKVSGQVREQRKKRFSLKSLFFSPLPAVALLAMVFVAVVTFNLNKEKKTPGSDPFFKDPLMAEAIDDSAIEERDIPPITDQIAANEIYTSDEDPVEYSYHKEFASLSSDELDRVYQAVKREPSTGG
ncbi:MAG: zf-HC2 domain-containing protein [Dissulfurispiraceae bacterium]